MNTKKKMILGLVTIVCIVTIASIVSYSIVTGDEPPERDPDDPGNTNGPGFDFGETVIGLGKIIIDIPIDTGIFTLTS